MSKVIIRQLVVPARPSSSGYSCRATPTSSFHSSTRNFEWVKTRLDDRRLLSLSGPNSKNFLQGLVTNNVKKIESSVEDRRATWTGFLTPPGRLQFDGFLYPDQLHNQDSLLIDHHSLQTVHLQTWLRRFVLRSKVVIKSDSREIWAIWPNHSSDPELETHSFLHEQESASIWKDCRGDQRLGYRILINPALDSDLRFLASLPTAPLSAYTLHALLHASLPPSLSTPYPINFPFEANLDYHHAIDFRKGCYVGQELTARTYHTGVIRKRMVAVSIGRHDHESIVASPTIPDSFSSIDTQIEDFVGDHPYLNPALQSMEFFSSPQSDAEVDSESSNSHAKKLKPPKSTGKMCGPIITTTTATTPDGDNHETRKKILIFGLALLRIDHGLFDPSSPSWPLFDLNVPNDPSRWFVQPIKPGWWPASNRS